jgi:DNA-binding SARP family transcriptional activator
MNALWPDLEPDAAGNNVRKAVHLARRAPADDPDLAGTLLLGDKETISLPGDVWTDVGAFRSAAASARRSSDPTDYETALDLYLGDLLPDDRYEEWVAPTLDELRAELVSLLAEQAGLLEARGDLDEAAVALRRALVAEPLDEDLAVRLMRVLALRGRRHEAVEVYERFSKTLAAEIGTDPSLETQRLRQEIAAGEELDLEVTAELWARIGDLRMRSGDPAGAAMAFESAISRGEPSASALATLHLSASRAHLGAHETTRAERHIDAAESLLPADRGARARIATLRANVAWERGDLVAADGLAREAIDLAEGGDPDDVAAANEAFAIVCHFRGAWPGGLSEEIDRLGRLPDADTALAGVYDIHHCIGQYHLYGDGLWEHVEGYARETLDRAGRLGAVRAQAFAWCLLGESLLLQARYEEAEGYLERSGELHASLGERSGALAWQRLAELFVCRGQLDEAAPPLRRASAIATVSPMAPHLWGRIYAACPGGAAQGRSGGGRASRAIGGEGGGSIRRLHHLLGPAESRLRRGARTARGRRGCSLARRGRRTSGPDVPELRVASHGRVVLRGGQGRRGRSRRGSSRVRGRGRPLRSREPTVLGRPGAGSSRRKRRRALEGTLRER